MNTINVENCKTLLIGRRGENEVTTVAFDFTEWASEFGSGVVDLYVKRFVDESAYPVVLTIDGTVASWLVTETDTNVAGYGKAEYVYRVDGKIAKSAVFPFFVAEDIGQPASEPPDPYESWLEQLTALGAETEAHAQAAEQSAEDAAESAEDAAQSAASAESYAGQAETAAGLAQTAQTASEAARDAAQTAQANAESFAAAASGAEAAAETAQGKAEDAQDAAEAAQASAESSATAAGASATTASTAATQAEAAKTAAQSAQTAAEQAAQQAHVEYEQLSGEVDDLSDEVAQQKSAFEAHEQYAEETYAKQDGTYEDLTAGNAYELLSDRGDTNQQPYLFRKTGGDSSAYNRERLKKIIGGTVAFNQLLSESTLSPYATTIKTITPQKVVLTPNGSFSTTLHYGASLVTSALNAIPLNHVLFVCVDCASTQADKFRVRIGNSMFWSASVSANTTTRINAIGRFVTGTLTVYAYDDTLYSNTDEITFQNWNIFDLTQMFGTAIADYIYSLEQATAGAGVAFFRSLFPADYYGYNPGELMSVGGVSAHETVGFNQWDEEWNQYGSAQIKAKNRIPVIAGATYYAKCGAQGLSLYFFKSADGPSVASAIPNNSTFTVPKNCHFMMLYTNSGYGTTYNHDICINLSDPKRNGTYEPYKKRTYPLDSSLTLRGIPKLDSNNRLYYDGDTYEPDGTVTRKYGIVDLGTLNWMYGSSRFYAVLTQAAPTDGKTSPNAICFKYQFSGLYDAGEKTFYISTGHYLSVWDSAYTDAATFKAAMSGVYLVYELATPTTETAEPYRELEICDRDGTEEFVSTSIVPVGHETFYPVNVFDYIDRLTEPDADMIADSAIAANKYFSVGNRLFLSTASIAAGAQIIPGTNCQETSLAAALNALNA